MKMLPRDSRRSTELR